MDAKVVRIGGATVDVAWARLGPQLRLAGVERLAIVGIARPAGFAMLQAARPYGVECVLVDGLMHRAPRRAMAAARRADLVVLCVSGPVAHGVTIQFRRWRIGAQVVAVYSRGADGISRELEAWLGRCPTPALRMAS